MIAMLPLDYLGLDPMVTPALICSADGSVVYKNPTARHHVPRPKSNFSLYKHMTPETRQTLLRPLKSPAVLSLLPSDITYHRHALVIPFSLIFEEDHLTEELAGYTVWFFPVLLQLPSPPFESLSSYADKMSAADLRLLRSLMLSSARPFMGDISHVCLLEEQLIRALYELQPGRYSAFALTNASLLCRLLNTFAASLYESCHISLQTVFEDFGSSTFVFTDSTGFALIYLKLLLFLSSLAAPSAAIRAETYLIGGWIEIESTVKVSAGVARTLFGSALPEEGDLRSFSSVLPERFLTVLDVCSLCRVCGFDLSYRYVQGTAELQLFLKIKSVNNDVVEAVTSPETASAEEIAGAVTALLLGRTM